MKMLLKEAHEAIIKAGYGPQTQIINPLSDDAFLRVKFRNTAKIEIKYYYRYPDWYRVRAFIKSKYGGYKLTREGRPPNSSIGSEWHTQKHRALIDAIQYFDSLPPATSKEEKPKDDKDIILQNAIARAIQEKIGGKIVHLSRTDGGYCNITLGYVFVRIEKNKIDVTWSTLTFFRQNRTIYFDPHTFDPHEVIDAIVQLQLKQIAIQDELMQLGNCFNKWKAKQ